MSEDQRSPKRANVSAPTQWSVPRALVAVGTTGSNGVRKRLAAKRPNTDVQRALAKTHKPPVRFATNVGRTAWIEDWQLWFAKVQNDCRMA